MRLAVPVRQSSFVRRLIRAHDDPVKQRVRAWMTEIDDKRLLAFGLTHEDITMLRATARRAEDLSHRAGHGHNAATHQRRGLWWT